MKKPLYIAPAKRTFMIPEATWNRLAIYKIWWPPETRIPFGKVKKRMVKLADIYPWPPPEQSALLEVAPTAVKKKGKPPQGLA